MLNNGPAWELTQHTYRIKLLDIETELLLSGEVGGVEFEEDIFIFEVIVGLLLFQILSGVLDDLREFVGGKLSQGLVFENRAHR